jgi:undecaprenyl-diphosphatase
LASLDAGVFRFLNGTIANPVFDVIMPVITDSWALRILGAVVWLALIIRGGTRGRWAALLLIPLVAASDQLTSAVLKPLAGRLRPCEVLGNVHFWYQGNRWVWTPCEAAGGFKTSFGFPSSHAANVTASTLLLGLVYRKWVPCVGLSFAGLVSLSRVYTGVHWPSDVLAGIAIGAGLAGLAYLVFKRLTAKRPAAKMPRGG